MRNNVLLTVTLLVCCAALLVFVGCDSSQNSNVPFQPSNPYFYSVHTPFDIGRAWIEAFFR